MYCVIWSKKKEDNWSLFSNNCFIFEKEAQEFADKQRSRTHKFKVANMKDWFWGVYMKVKVNKDPDKPEKFTWSKHKKWLSTFTDCKIVYPENKPVKKKRGKNAKR